MPIQQTNTGEKQLSRNFGKTKLLQSYKKMRHHIWCRKKLNDDDHDDKNLRDVYVSLQINAHEMGSVCR